MIIPDQLDADLADILGMVPWKTGPIAHALRDDGANIARKMEAEQAATLHWLLRIYAEHGADWRRVAGEQLAAIGERIRAREAEHGGTSGAPKSET